MSKATLTSKGRITIPKDIRDQLRLKAGDRLGFALQLDGWVLVVPAIRHVREVRGILARPKRPVILEQMEKAIRDTAVSRTRHGR